MLVAWVVSWACFMVACIVMHIQHILQRLSHYFVGHMACYIAAAYTGSYRIVHSTAAHPANGDVLPNPEKAAGASDARQVVLQVHHIGSLQRVPLAGDHAEHDKKPPLRGQE